VEVVEEKDEKGGWEEKEGEHERSQR
jgi:hypothetical protein